MFLYRSVYHTHTHIDMPLQPKRLHLYKYLSSCLYGRAWRTTKTSSFRAIYLQCELYYIVQLCNWPSASVPTHTLTHSVMFPHSLWSVVVCPFRRNSWHRVCCMCITYCKYIMCLFECLVVDSLLPFPYLWLDSVSHIQHTQTQTQSIRVTVCSVITRNQCIPFIPMSNVAHSHGHHHTNRHHAAPDQTFMCNIVISCHIWVCQTVFCAVYEHIICNIVGNSCYVMDKRATCLWKWNNTRNIQHVSRMLAHADAVCSLHPFTVIQYFNNEIYIWQM